MGALKIILILTLYLFPGELLEGCQTPQYLQFGKSGIIHCDLNDTFSSVFWYDSVNILDDEPVVTFSHLIKGGHGYESGEFDITQDGSLLILDVGLKHEKNFSMARFSSFDESPTVFTVSVVVTGITADGCASPQYLTYGRKGVVHCFFQNLENVFWYNSTQALSDSPIVTYGNSAKGGHGYESGEFDIFTNGSLVINDVRLVHDNNFTVAFSSLNEVPVYFVVHVIVTVKYLGEGPVIEKCDSANTTCFIEFRNLTDISCIVERVRPAVSLKWLSLTRYGYHKVSFDVEFINNNLTFTSFAVISNASAFLPILSLLVCRAEFAPGVMQRDESLVLVHNNNINLLNEPPVMKYVLHGSTFELNCSSTDVLFLVWKRSFPYGNRCQSLMFALIMDNSFISKHQDNFELKRNGSLVLHQTDTEHDGLYCCIHGDGFSGGISKYKVITYVKPIPAYPVIEGCASRSACELDVKRKGNLTCTMTGVRPAIKLKWKVSNETSSQEIYFFDHISAVTKSGETFSITLTSSFSIPTATQITLICGVAGSIRDIFSELSLVNLTLASAPVKSKDDSSLVMKIVFPLLLIVAVLIICGLCLRLRKVQRVKKTQHAKFRKVMNSFELELNVWREETRDLKKRLIHQIKQNYQRLHHAGHPIRFKRYRLLKRNTVFVDGCLEKLATSETRERLTQGCQQQSHGVRRTSVWIKQSSYSDVINDTLKYSTRLIIEGKPGYGKSTITLQMAHDWCINVPYLEDVEIFILLRLCQLREVQSLYQAIQKFILPWNSKITETEIKDILDNSESLVIVLDGYDEYRVNYKDSKNFVVNILKGENFQNARVILTTTPSALPKICGAQQTERIRLTGFDDKAKDEYIRKALGGGEDAIKDIKQRISENPIAYDLCQAPFFFCMAVHMCQEVKSSTNVDTATGFFKFLMQCLYKETEQEPRQLEKLSKTRDILNKEAFESLHGKRYWEAEKLLERLGEGFYYHCVRAGILVQEDVCETSNNFKYTEFRKVTTVRFFHHLFYEWHAAQHLGKMISKLLKINWPPSGLAVAYNYHSLTSGECKPTPTCNKHIESLLSGIESCNLQYIYRFTCDVNADSAVSITQYLKNKGYSKYFIMQCIIEHVDDEKILPILSKLCSTDIFITSANTVMQQKTTVEILKTASRYKIPVTKLRLLDSFKRISDGSIQLQSECQFPPLLTLKGLEILITEGNLTMKEFEDISNYVSKCFHLETLLFSRCDLPRDVSKSNSMQDLESRNISVIWHGREGVKRWNYQGNEWEAKEALMQDVGNIYTPKNESSYENESALDAEWQQSSTQSFSLRMQPNVVEKTGGKDIDRTTGRTSLFTTLLEKLGLMENFKTKLSLLDAMRISLADVAEFQNASVVEQFITKLNTYNRNVQKMDLNITVEHNESNQRSTNDEWTVIDTELRRSTSEVTYSPRDILYAILHCIDPFFLQDVLMKLSACQIAVPVLLPDPTGSNVTFLLWGLRKIVKSWFSDKNLSSIEEKTIIQHEMPTVTAIRIGKVPVSKSDTLNKLLGPTQGNEEHAFFMSCEQSSSPATLSEGTLECMWFLPGNEKGPIPIPFALMNLRGDYLHHRRQAQFSIRMSFVTIIFIDAKFSTRYKEFVELIRSSCHVIVVLCLNNPDGKRQKPSCRTFLNAKYHLTQIVSSNSSALSISAEISRVINDLVELNEINSLLSLENAKTWASELTFQIDEDNEDCIQAKQLAFNVFYTVLETTPSKYKEQYLPLQDIWEKWSKNDKIKIRGCMKNLDTDIANHEAVQKDLRCKQALVKISTQLQALSDFMIDSNKKKRDYLFAWLQIYLNDISACFLKPLTKQLIAKSLERRKLCTEINKMEKKIRSTSTTKANKELAEMKQKETKLAKEEQNLLQQFEDNSLGVEHYMREFGQLVESYKYFDTAISLEYIKKLPVVAAEMLLNGHPFEIFDGGASQVPLVWLRQVFKALAEKTPINSTVFVISVIGIQNSGKTTLLNSMFGVKFGASVKRCTRGVFMQLLPIKNEAKDKLNCDYLVIVDTEGFRAPEKTLHSCTHQDYHFATLALCISDLTLINIGGLTQTMGEDMMNVLHIAAHAFVRMTQVNLKPQYRIIHQFVEDVTADRKHEAATQSILMSLDEAAWEAAQEERKEHRFSQFSDVYNLDIKGVEYLPCLWRGFMDPPNRVYSLRVQQLRSTILKSIKNPSPLTLLEFSQRIADVWNAIVKEDFVFSFQNTKEASV